MASFLDVCRFTPTLGGTTDWTVSAAVTGYQTPASAGAVNGAIYRYRAESADLSQWEVGYGAYTVAGTVLARTTVLFNSAGTTAKINFSAAPQVAVVALGEDLDPIDGALFGLTLSTAGASATFSVAAGWAGDSTAASIMRLYSALAKTTGAWVAGNAAGSFDGVGSAPSATAGWYHVHLIKRLDTGVVDVLTSNSATAPTLPTNYNLSRRIGSIKTNGSFQWIGFIQDGDTFQWLTNSQDIAAVNPGTAAVSRTMNTPLGVRVEGIFGVGGIVTSTSLAIYISDLSATDEVASAVGPVISFEAVGSVTQLGVGNQRVFTNTSSQIRSRVAASGADLTLYLSTRGWVDRRGRDA